MDAKIGEMLAELERRQLLDRTLVVFLSDNGAPFPREKGTLYDGGTRTPLVLVWPTVLRAGAVWDRGMVSTVDLAPTLLELAGARVPEDMQGRSFRALLDAPDSFTGDPYVFSERNWHDCDEHQRAVRTTRFKLIRTDAYTDLPLCTAADIGASASFLDLRARARTGRLTDGAAAAVRGAARAARAVRPAQGSVGGHQRGGRPGLWRDGARARGRARVMDRAERRLPGGVPRARRQHRPDHRGALHHEDPAAPKPGAAARGGAVGRAGTDLSPRTPAAAPAPAMIWTSSYEQPAGSPRILRRSAGRAG